MELDDAYAVGVYIEGAEDYPPRWLSEARSFREHLGTRAELALPYGDSERQVFDLFHPEGEPKGTVIFIHGGYWRAFDRNSWSHLAAGPLEKGWAVAMPSYDLCPEVSIATISRQIASAVQAIADRTRGPISITGNSAGGHLSARMLDPGLIPEATASRFAANVPISPLADLRPLLNTSMNADFEMTLADAEAESPIFMQHRHAARVAVWIGADERPSFIEQSRWLSEAWQISMVTAPGRHHFDIPEALINAESDLVRYLTTP